MSNRKKARKRHLSLVGKLPQVAPMGLAANITLPPDEKAVVKEVPATVTVPEGVECDGSWEIIGRDDGTRAVQVGIAQIYEDGTVGVVLDDGAPQWAKDYIRSEADTLGYSIGEN